MATLKISDLSVGDWVYVKWKGDDKWQGQIRETSCTGRLEARLLDDTPFNVRCTIEFVEPIPITPEILEANGIRRTYEDDEYAIFRGDGLWAVKYSKGDWELSTPPVCRVDIKFIHQLQHALRLAGVDKEIVMPKK